jgi:hypothetical protein
MMLSAASILAYLGLTWLLHRGDYARTAPSRSASQEVLEAVVVAAALLVVRHLPLNVLGQTGWPGTYLAFGLLAPAVLERFVRRRSWAAVGWRKPTNQQALAIGFGLLALYALSALYRILILGAPYYFDWGRLAYYAAFAYVEEVQFRGVVQTRLESAWS